MKANRKCEFCEQTLYIRLDNFKDHQERCQKKQRKRQQQQLSLGEALTLKNELNELKKEVREHRLEESVREQIHLDLPTRESVMLMQQTLQSVVVGRVEKLCH